MESKLSSIDTPSVPAFSSHFESPQWRLCKQRYPFPPLWLWSLSQQQKHTRTTLLWTKRQILVKVRRLQVSERQRMNFQEVFIQEGSFQVVAHWVLRAEEQRGKGWVWCRLECEGGGVKGRLAAGGMQHGLKPQGDYRDWIGALQSADRGWDWTGDLER